MNHQVIQLVRFFQQKLKILVLIIQQIIQFVLQPIFPEVLLLESLTSFDKIGISSAGKNYNIAPNLVVLDGLTGKNIDDVDLFYKLGDSEVTIRKNTKGISNITPTIIPITIQMELQSTAFL